MGLFSEIREEQEDEMFRASIPYWIVIVLILIGIGVFIGWLIWR